MKEIWNSMLKFVMGEDYAEDTADKEIVTDSYETVHTAEAKKEIKKSRIPNFQKKEKNLTEEKERSSRYSDSSSHNSYSFNSSLKNSDFDTSRNNRSRVVNMASGNQNTIITAIKEYADCKDIVRQLKEKKAVIINVDQIDKITAKRVVDFLSGAVTAIDGDIKKLSNSIVIVAPNNVKLTGMFGENIPSNITETLFAND